MGLIFGQTANRRGALGFQGGSRIFFLWGHTGGSQPEHGTHPPPFWKQGCEGSGCTIFYLLVQLESRICHALCTGCALWQLILNFVRLLRVFYRRKVILRVKFVFEKVVEF